MDNLGSNKGSTVRDLIKATGAELRFLPPYSPDINPIESAFSQIKAHLKKVAERTVDRLWDRIGEVVDFVTQDHAQNYFNAVGYASNCANQALEEPKYASTKTDMFDYIDAGIYTNTPGPQIMASLRIPLKTETTT